MTAVLLRPLASGDLERIHRWHNDPALFRHLGNPFQPVTREAAAGWLAARVAAWPRELNLAICVARSRRHVGNIYLRDINPAAGRAELHVFIAARRDRGRGIGSAAIAALCRRAFAELGLREVFVRVLEDNAAAMHVYEKCGFRRCGATPPSVRKGGRELAVCRLALSAP